MKYYVFSLDGTFVGELTPIQLEKLTGLENDPKKINYAIKTEKGYGYYNGYYISSTYCRILNKKELQLFFHEWVNKNFNLIETTIKKYKSNIDEDCLHDVILYVSERILTNDVIYSFLYEIRERYFSKLIDNARKIQRINTKEERYIKETFVDEFDSEYSEDYSSINNIHYIDIIKNYISIKFSDENVTLFFDYLINYKKKNGGYESLSKKYNKTVQNVRTILKNMQLFLINNKKQLLSLFDKNSYKTIDEYTLLNIFE